MASITRHGKRWRAQVYVHGKRESCVRDTKAEAAAWALERQSMLSGRKVPAKRFSDAMARYARDVSPTKNGARWEIARLKRMQGDAVARCALARLSASDMADYRDRRLQDVSGASVRREMVLLGSVLEMARREWGWIRTNPLREVRKPPSPPSRKRRITEDEVWRMTLAFGLGDGLKADTSMQRTGLAFLFGLETAMRAGEIVSMQKHDVHVPERFVHLPRTKNGDSRDVPLTLRAVEILETLPGHVFDLNTATRDVMFRRARDTTQIHDLHFHDSRAEAIWRLSKKLDVLQLARVIGHRDLKSLMIYYQESASDMARLLG